MPVENQRDASGELPSLAANTTLQWVATKRPGPAQAGIEFLLAFRSNRDIKEI